MPLLYSLIANNLAPIASATADPFVNLLQYQLSEIRKGELAFHEPQRFDYLNVSAFPTAISA